MVNAVALNAVTAGQGVPVAALPQPSAAALQTLSAITQGGLSETQISSLSAAVAQVDAGVQSESLREALFSQVEGLGMFYRSTNTEGFPRWPLMTALRAYGLNLSGQNSQPEAAVAAQVQQNLNSAAQQTTGHSLNRALAAATAAQVVGPTISRAPAARPAPVKTSAPAPETPAPVNHAIDQLV